MVTIQVRPVGTTGPTMNDYYEDRVTHQNLEEAVLPIFLKSPDYSLSNVAGYSGWQKLRLFQPFDRNNNPIARMSRFMKERLYITDCGTLDKISTIAILISAILAIVIVYQTIPMDVVQVYQFANPADANDATKVAKLQTLNNAWTGSTYVISKAALIAIPGLITAWQIFKRTTVHRDGYGKRMNMKNAFKRVMNIKTHADN
jgi:hypothetical protein